MYFYAVLLLIGFFGIVAMAASGFLRLGGHRLPAGRARGAALRSAGRSSGGRAGHAPSARFHARRLLSFSPVDVFSFAAGAGMAGLLAKNFASADLRPWIAAAGGLLFVLCVTRPIFWALGHFAAEPSTGLEGSVAYSAVAVTTFDANGQGLIRLTLDGQITQLLATLETHERSAGVRVLKGDTVLVIDVDAQHNRCLVTKEFEIPMESGLS